MWNWTGSRSPPVAADDGSWEAEADAAGDSGRLTGTTWPPRSYSCTFCCREFKSAQALGGHMNVHRRDRAKLRSLQGRDVADDPATSSWPSSAARSTVFPAPAFVANGGILVIYPIGAAGAGAKASPPSFASSLPCGEVGTSSSASPPVTKGEGDDGVVVKELDLELRLGRRP